MTASTGSSWVRGALALAGIFMLTFSASLYYALTTPDEYSAEALVQFRPRPTENGGVVGADTATSAAAGYAAYLGAPSTIEVVADALGLTTKALKEGQSASLIPATTSLAVGFSSGDPEIAAQGANALARSAVARATDDPLVSATVLAPAGVPGAPSGPLRTLIIVAGALLGLLMTAAAYFFYTSWGRSRVTDPEWRPFQEDDDRAQPDTSHFERKNLAAG